MTTGTQVALPDNFQLPAHLQTPEAQAAIAAGNAAAGGGIRIGGFPRISIKGGKFHLVKGGETHTILNPPEAPGAPPLPKMLLQVVVVAANPAIVKTYYEGKFQDGDDGEPNCSSDNGVTPDSHIAAPQHSVCATCKQNAWGSKISEASGKEIKACGDSKRIVILPAENLDYEAYALSVTASALTAWGKYVKALSDKKIPISAVVTNVMFDSTASYPKLVFSFGRLLTAEEYAKVLARAVGDDVQNIVSPVRQISVPVPLLPPPASTAPVESPVAVPPPPATPAVTGFGAPAPVTPSATPPAEPEVKRTRKPREQPAPSATGVNHDAVLAGAGPVGSPTYCAVFKALTGTDYGFPLAVGAETVTAPPPPVAPAAPTGGFGATTPSDNGFSTPDRPAAQPAGDGGGLAAKLAAKLAALKKPV